MDKPICKIDGCERPRKGRGWCGTHWLRWRKYGDPHYVKRNVYASPEESFAARAERRGDCLIWTGSKRANGYGVISVNGKSAGAHRYAWERENGPIPDGVQVDHVCHNRACVNVEHLRLATRSENNSHLQGAKSHSGTGLRNVYAHKGGWHVRLQHRGERHYLGTYPTAEEAAEVAARAREELFGEFAGKG